MTTSIQDQVTLFQTVMAEREEHKEARTQKLQQLKGVVQTIRMWSKDPLRKSEFTPLIPLLSQLMELVQEEPTLRMYVLDILANICSGSQTAQVVSAGIVPVAIRWLTTATGGETLENCIYILANVAGDSIAHRDLVHQQGVAAPLVRYIQMCLKSQKYGYLYNGIWLLNNLYKGKPYPESYPITPFVPFLRTFLQLLAHTAILEYTCWLLSYVAVEDSRQWELLQSGISGPLVALLGHDSEKVRLSALRATGNFFSGNSNAVDAIMDSHPIDFLKELLQQPKCAKDVVWACSNMVAEEKHIATVLEANLFEQIVQKRQQPEIQKDIAWFVGNLVTTGTDEQIQTCIDQEAILVLCDLLTPKLDEATLRKVRGALQRILALGYSGTTPRRMGVAVGDKTVGDRHLLTRPALRQTFFATQDEARQRADQWEEYARDCPTYDLHLKNFLHENVDGIYSYVEHEPGDPPVWTKGGELWLFQAYDNEAWLITYDRRVKEERKNVANFRSTGTYQLPDHKDLRWEALSNATRTWGFVDAHIRRNVSMIPPLVD